MTVIVEDGTLVEDANSYVSLADVRVYATARGITLPALDDDLETKLHLAMDWFEGFEFTGARVDATQELSFPRSGVIIDGVSYENTQIPPRVLRVIMQATCDAVTIELEPAYAGQAGGAVKRKKLDVIEKEFFAASWASEQPRLTKLMKLISPLIGGGLSSGQLKVHRV